MRGHWIPPLVCFISAVSECAVKPTGNGGGVCGNLTFEFIAIKSEGGRETERDGEKETLWERQIWISNLWNWLLEQIAMESGVSSICVLREGKRGGGISIVRKTLFLRNYSPMWDDDYRAIMQARAKSRTMKNSWRPVPSWPRYPLSVISNPVFAPRLRRKSCEYCRFELSTVFATHCRNIAASKSSFPSVSDSDPIAIAVVYNPVPDQPRTATRWAGMRKRSIGRSLVS